MDITLQAIIPSLVGHQTRDQPFKNNNYLMSISSPDENLSSFKFIM